MNKILKSAVLLTVALTSSLFGQRSVMVNSSNSVLLYPNNFWSVNASAARAGLGLIPFVTNPVIPITNGGTGATNAAAARTNLGLGLSALTNTNAANFRTNIGLGLSALTNTNTSSFRSDIGLSLSALTNTNTTNFRVDIGLGWSALTNTNAADFRNSIGLGLSALTNTNNDNFRTNIGLVLAALTNTNAFNFRTSIGLGWLALTNTNAATALLGYSTNGHFVTGTNTSRFTNTIEFGNSAYIAPDGEIITTNSISASLFSGGLLGTLTVVDGGVGISFENTDDSGICRTNLGLGWTALTNTNSTNFLSDIGLGFANPSNTSFTLNESESSSNPSWHEVPGFKWSFNTFGASGTNYFALYPIFNPFGTQTYGLRFGHSTNSSNLETKFYIAHDGHIEAGGTSIFDQLEGGINIPTNKSITFSDTLAANETRTNLGLGWSALTNSNSGTRLVSVDTNGSVVSPTNFWQIAPIQTLVQTFVPTVTSNSYATNARNLYVYSSGTNVSGITNTVILPTNSYTFDGDTATITHEGLTNSVTAVKQNGSATNFLTISNYAESVKFIHEAGQWTFYHNISFVEAIRFADGNIELNKAQSRTNLGLGFSALTNTNTTNFQVAIFNTNSAPTNSANVNGISFNSAVAWLEVNVHTNGTTNSYRIPLFK